MRGRWFGSAICAVTLSAAMVGAQPKAEAPSAEAKAAYQQALDQKKAKALDKALSAAQHAVELSPGYLEAHNLLAWLYVGTNERDKAIAEFRAVIRLAPDSPQAVEAKAALDRWQVPHAEPAAPVAPTQPVAPTPPVAPTQPVAPTPPVQPDKPPVKPAAVDPNDPDSVWAPKEDRPPAGVGTMSTPELFKKLADVAAAHAKAKKYEEAFCAYRHLLVLDPTNDGLRGAVETLRGTQPERHDLLRAEDQLRARAVLAALRPATDLKDWPRFDKLLHGSELRMLLDPRVVGDGRYGTLRYAGCDPYVPVVLFCAKPTITVQALRELVGTPQVEGKTWDQSLSLLTWGHMRVVADAEGKVLYVLRKMGEPSPEDPTKAR